MYFSIKDEKFQKNVMKLGKKLAISSKKTAILNLYKMKNI